MCKYNAQIAMVATSTPRPEIRQVTINTKTKYLGLNVKEQKFQDGSGLKIIFMIGPMVPGTPASESGQIEMGDRLLSVNGNEFADLGELKLYLSHLWESSAKAVNLKILKQPFGPVEKWRTADASEALD